MSAARRSPRSWPRRAPTNLGFLVAAFLALALQLMFPAGYMVAEPGQAHGFPIVICSGQGQIVADWNALETHEAGRKHTPAKTMADCPFAGHAVASDPPAPTALATAVAFSVAQAPARAWAVFPGRGLAAPPPPAIGPPQTI